MKNKFILFTLFSTICLTGSVLAQESLWDALKQAGEMYNEQHGIDESDQGGGELTPEQEAWKQEWDKKKDEYAEVLADLDDKNLSCVALMVLYVYDYDRLIARTERESDCRLKYDLYGMQLLSMTSSTTVMYCPEGLSMLSNEELGNVSQQYFELALGHIPDYSFFDAPEGEGINGDWSELTTWQSLAVKTGILDDKYRDARDDYELAGGDLNENIGFIRFLIEYFKPSYIVPRTLTVGHEMEVIAAACPGL